MSPELIVTLIVGIASPICTMIVSLFSTRAKMKEILMNSLRANIQSVYYRYEEKKKIPMAEYAGVCSMFDQYVANGGNSYVKGFKAEMDKWEKE